MCYSAEVVWLCLKAGREKEHQRTTITSFSFFGGALKANHLCNLTAKKTAEVSQTYIFIFFLCSEEFSKEGEGNYFYMRQLFYLKQLLNCWIDLLREKYRVNNTKHVHLSGLR